MDRYSKARIYEGWEKIVRATLLREELRMIGNRSPSTSSSTTTTSSPAASSSPFPPTPPSRLRPLSSFHFPTSFLVGDSFTYNQILRATNYFSNSNFIKNGHTGDLFYGVLEDGMKVVVKKVDLSSSFDSESFLISELKIFGKVSHPRLVPMVGHCLDDVRLKFLVYEYMPRRDLSSSLFRKKVPQNDDEDDDVASLDWITRLKIAVGVAEGLCYLHHYCVASLVHRDIQASSILLDDKFEARLGSLGEVCVADEISRFLKGPGQQTIGSRTFSYDVYCLGKVLLELVTGHLGFSVAGESTMKDWKAKFLPFIDRHQKELVKKIVDPTLELDEHLLTQVWAVSRVAKACLNSMPSERPLIMHVLDALEDPLTVVNQDNSKIF